MKKKNYERLIYSLIALIYFIILILLISWGARNPSKKVDVNIMIFEDTDSLELYNAPHGI